MGEIPRASLGCRGLLTELMTEANGARVPQRGKSYDEFRAELESADRLPRHYNPFELRLKRG